jgi:5-methylcytosine-specific restriction endonuclease McrBC regulatory subunit McrC
MLLGELILRRKCIKMEINELKNNIFSSEEKTDVNALLNRLFELEDQFQKHNILTEHANNEIKVTVGNSKTTLTNAIKLRNATDRKADTLTKLIESNNKSLDIINLIEQRQKLIEEYILLNNAISSTDWSTNVD